MTTIKKAATARAGRIIRIEGSLMRFFVGDVVGRWGRIDQRGRARAYRCSQSDGGITIVEFTMSRLRPPHFFSESRQ